jgi:hypothetical protein
MDTLRDFQRTIYGGDADTREEQLRRDREVAAEMALRDHLIRQFGSYEIDGAAGVIRNHQGVAINYRALAQAAIAHADMTEGRPMRGAREAA